jgi:hypothetical protein
MLYKDPTPDLERQLGDVLTPELDSWNGDDIGSWLGANRSRIADLRNKRLDRADVARPSRQPWRNTLPHIMLRLGPTGDST